jgi:hypothetical protein
MAVAFAAGVLDVLWHGNAPTLQPPPTDDPLSAILVKPAELLHPHRVLSASTPA